MSHVMHANFSDPSLRDDTWLQGAAGACAGGRAWGAVQTEDWLSKGRAHSPAPGLLTEAAH